MLKTILPSDTSYILLCAVGQIRLELAISKWKMMITAEATEEPSLCCVNPQPNQATIYFEGSSDIPELV